MDADVIVTTTASRSAMVVLKDLKPSVTLITVGADTPGKQEIAPEIIHHIVATKGKLVADKKEQVVRLGDLQYAPAHIKESEDAIVELSQIVVGKKPGREADEMILCDLTGVGAQDAAICEKAFRKCTASL